MTTLLEHDSRALTPRQIAAIIALTYSIWPSQTRSRDEVIADYIQIQQRIGILNPLSTSPPVRYVVWDDEQVVAHASTFERTVSTAAGDLRLMALSAVAVRPDYRGQGLGRAVVEHAFGRIGRGDFGVSLFQTSIPPFYEKLGAVEVHNQFVNSADPAGPETPAWSRPGTMIYPSSYGWPDGRVDLVPATDEFTR